MKHTEFTTRCGEDYTTRRTEIYPSGVLESVIALIIVLSGIPLTAILVKGAVIILNPPAKNCEVRQ
jgi:hypothetical protein